MKKKLADKDKIGEQLAVLFSMNTGDQPLPKKRFTTTGGYSVWVIGEEAIKNWEVNNKPKLAGGIPK